MTELHSATDLPQQSRQLVFASANTIGIRFDRLRAEVRGCRLRFDGSPIEFAPEIHSTVSEPLSSDLLRRFTSIERETSTMEEREQLASELTAIAIRLAEQLISGVAGSIRSGSGNNASEDILAIGIHGSGTWQRDSDGVPCFYHENINASHIAERLGKTVIDDFPSRDLALGGRGGPVEVHGNWVLLADRSTDPGCHWRALLDIAPFATHFSLIGPIGKHLRSAPLLSNDICVGNRLLNELVTVHDNSKFANVASEVVDYEKLALNGQLIPELLEIWQATNARNYGWQAIGLSALPYTYALKDSIYAKTKIEDLLCTATHFFAREIEHYVKHCVPAANPVGELFVMGDGSKNALLQQLLDELLPGVSLRRLSEIGQDRTVHAASIAALAWLHIWQIPVPSTNTGEVPRVLGRLTPGSPTNWQRLLQMMTSSAPWLLPLREAV